METELDLRPYIRALLRRGTFIVAIAMGLAIAAALISFLIPVQSVANADLFIIPNSSQLTLDERFVTSDLSEISTPGLQREGLIALATSGTLEALARANLAPEVAVTFSTPGSLLGRVRVSPQGDLLIVTATAENPTEAKLLAETWAKSYQQLVGELYNGGEQLSSETAAQLSDAGERYDAAQQNLEAFIAGSTLAELEQRIVNLQSLLSNAANADQLLYTDYLNRVRDIDLVIADARTLRDQVADGQLDSLGNALALLSLRSRASGTAELPFTLNFDDPAAIGAGTSVSVEDLDQLTAVLQQRRTELLGRTQALARSLAAGDGDLIGLASQIRQRYIAELTELVRQQEAQQSQQRLFEQRRDIAFESLKLLQSKSDELEIARRSPQVEVRFINASIEQPPSLIRRLVLNGAIGFAIGLLVGVMLALALDVFMPGLRRLSTATTNASSLASQGEPKA